jgi:hypothetical protein
VVRRRCRFGRSAAALVADESQEAPNWVPGVREATFELRLKSGSWSHHPDRWHEPDARMTGFTLVVTRNGRPLGGHNLQVHVEEPGAKPGPLDDSSKPDLELSSGWGAWFRNHFARSPEAAAAIVGSIDPELSRATNDLAAARGEEMADLCSALFATTFTATGPDFWR